MELNTLRNALLALALTTAVLAFAPNAAAACEPLLDPTYCTGTVRQAADGIVSRTEELVDRATDLVDKILTLECEWAEPGIRCE